MAISTQPSQHGCFDLLQPGLSPYHHVGLLVPLLAALSPMLLGRILKDRHQVARSLVNGILVTVVAYGLLRFVPYIREDSLILNKAVLLGLLIAEVTIFNGSTELPSVLVIVFVVFMYLFGLAEVHQRPA
jgi:hypothetical protein